MYLTSFLILAFVLKGDFGFPPGNCVMELQAKLKQLKLLKVDIGGSVNVPILWSLMKCKSSILYVHPNGTRSSSAISTNVEQQLPYGGHQCGVCHHVSDAKVSIQGFLENTKKVQNIRISMNTFWVSFHTSFVSDQCVYIWFHGSQPFGP